MNKDKSKGWLILATAVLLVLTAETAILLDAVRENRHVKSVRECIEMRIYNLQTNSSQEREQYVEKMLTGFLSPEQLGSFAKSFWMYELFSVDLGLPQAVTRIPRESWMGGIDIEVPASGKLLLRFVQTEKPRALPLSMHSLGNLTRGDPLDSFESHLTVIADRKYTMTKEAKGPQTIVSYAFGGGVPGQTVRIDPDPILGSFLALE